jgi:hypothetical protein
MFVSTIRRVVGIAVVTGTFAALVPVAAADSGFQGSPDAIDRAAASRLAADTSFQGNPDAIERAVAARQSQTPFDRSAFAIERARDARQSLTYPPDAFERALVTNSNDRAKSLAAPVVDSTEISSSGGVDWSDFGLGAGLVLALLGLGAGIVAIRRSQQGVKTA